MKKRLREKLFKQATEQGKSTPRHRVAVKKTILNFNLTVKKFALVTKKLLNRIPTEMARGIQELNDFAARRK